jgi:hypothetical protein
MMTHATPFRWTGRSSRKAGAVLRLCVALLLVLQVVYTPIHLNLEPHAREGGFSEAALPAAATSLLSDADHEDADHHGRHPASHHVLKALRCERAPAMDLLVLPALELLLAEPVCLPPHVVHSSGLSPPALPRCWQFILRAALPVRAPSHLT